MNAYKSSEYPRKGEHVSATNMDRKDVFESVVPPTVPVTHQKAKAIRETCRMTPLPSGMIKQGGARPPIAPMPPPPSKPTGSQK